MGGSPGSLTSRPRAAASSQREDERLVTDLIIEVFGAKVIDMTLEHRRARLLESDSEHRRELAQGLDVRFLRARDELGERLDHPATQTVDILGDRDILPGRRAQQVHLRQHGGVTKQRFMLLVEHPGAIDDEVNQVALELLQSSGADEMSSETTQRLSHLVEGSLVLDCTLNSAVGQTIEQRERRSPLALLDVLASSMGRGAGFTP